MLPWPYIMQLQTQLFTAHAYGGAEAAGAMGNRGHYPSASPSDCRVAHGKHLPHPFMRKPEMFLIFVIEEIIMCVLI
jgi:hypothetical protein